MRGVPAESDTRPEIIPESGIFGAPRQMRGALRAAIPSTREIAVLCVLSNIRDIRDPGAPGLLTR